MSLKLRAAISALLLAPQAAFALGLGDIRLNSALNEPLSAEIELVAPTNEELNALSAQLASRELFQRYGLDRPGFLDSVEFTVGRGRDGRNVLRINSAAPISEPFVTFLVEVNWPRGRLLREYTVLLDPPVFAPQETVPPAPVAAPRASRPTAPAAAPAPAAAVTEPVSAPPRPAAAPADLGSSYRVQPGDTLYGVASRFAGGDRAETNRMMIAMFRANPEAFGGNINVLRSGAILRVPGPEALGAVGAGEAASEIGRQTAAWRGGEVTQEPARLRLVTPAETAPEPATAEPVAADPSERIAQLNREIQESQRLLELKNAELARLQQQVAEEAAAAQAAAQPEAEAPVEVPAEEAPAEQAPAEQAPAAEAEPAPPAAPEAQPEPAPAERSFVDRLTENWQYVLGAAALLLGGGLAWGYVRRRREEEAEDEAIRNFEPQPSAPVPSETQRLRALSPAAAGAASGVLVGTATEDQEFEEFHTSTLPPSGRKAEDFGASFDDTLSAEEPAELDQGDPLAEADFHMAYGLYDQAADIIKLAQQKEPGRRDLKLKLLEIFFVSGDKTQFLDAARKFDASRTDGDAAAWDRVQIMGRQLAPEDPLFESEASAAGVDLNLEGGDTRVDLELLAPPEGEEGIDLDLGQALEEAADAEAETGRNEALDLDLGSESPTRELPRLDDRTAEMPAADAPTVETTRLQPVSPDTTAEMAVDDLGIDLGDLDALSGESQDDDVTRIAPAGEATRELPSSGDTMDFDLSELSPEVTSAGSIDDTQRVDMDVGGAMFEAEVSDTVTEQVSLDELPEMSELEPVTMSEVGTKLDLARAYVDMGDPDGARSILEEVLKEGSGSQKQEAQRLLDSLPGA